MDKQSSTLQQRIEKTAQRLATLKACQQAAAARERLRATNVARRARNRALVLWGVALEREVLMEHDAVTVVRELLEKHLVRQDDRESALAFLSAVKGSQP
jgi:hypothetical protein